MGRIRRCWGTAGAFGVVHRAIQPHVGREVAVKVIRPELANDPRYLRRLEAEAQLVAHLGAPTGGAAV